ncbi:MAG: hypothetical protein HGB02_07070 [Chlorobiaceae bacterium]|nr:hypothetical protein [Chlorobiaceae bacterium]
MTEKAAHQIIRQLEAEKYLNAIQSLQDEILKIEVQSGPADSAPASARRKIRSLSGVIEKISEAAAFGNEWDEGRKAKKAAIGLLQKIAQ